jgi:hypothetical protein
MADIVILLVIWIKIMEELSEYIKFMRWIFL